MRNWIMLMIGLLVSFSALNAQKNRKEMIGFEKTACFGKCPVYKLTVYSDGYVLYEGLRFSEKMGKWEKKLKRKEKNSLCKSFKEADLWQYEDMYESELVDLATTHMSFTYKDKTKTISGKIERPEALLALDAQMVTLAESEGWTQLTKPKNLSNHPEMDIIENEVVVELKLGVLVDEWVEQYPSYGVQVIRKLSPQRAYWLLSYDTNLIAPDAFITLLKKDEQVLQAEFNKKVDKREE